MLISPDRVNISSYYHKWIPGFRLMGYISVTPYTAPPPYETWNDAVYNPFCAIAAEATVDGKPTFVLPVFVNDVYVQYRFDGEKEEDLDRPAIAFFKGNDDWHYALRFADYSERDAMIQFFGEDLGFLQKDLIGHN